MVVALLLMIVLTGLGAIVFTTASSNLQNAGRDRSAASAMGVSEAGIAEALTYMRTNGTGLLTCSGPPSYTGCTNDWGYNYPTAGAGGHLVSLGAGRDYRVWVQQLTAPGGAAARTYRIYSVGTSGAGPGSRTVTTDVKVSPMSFPLSVFGNDFVRNGGNVQLSGISVFAKGCIGKRDRLTFDPAVTSDLAYPNLVPAAHSALWISNSQITSETDADCVASERQNIHRPQPQGPGFCADTNQYHYRFDQDLQGGTLTGTPCDPTNNGGRGLKSPPDGPGSYFDANSLKPYQPEPRGLPAAQYALIKQTAQAQGNFYDCVAGTPAGACSAAGDLTNFTPLNGANLGNAVVYAKLAPGKTLTITPSLLSGYGQAYCGQRSVLLVVEGGDLQMNNTLDLVAATFVPDGRAFVNGSATLTGTLYAKSVFLNGAGIRFQLQQCFFSNMPGGVMQVSPTRFQQLDR